MKNQINATTGAKTYNGWTNYETWAVKLWLDNDESDWTLQQELLEQAENNLNPSKVWTKFESSTAHGEEEIRFKLANLIEEWLKDNSPSDIQARCPVADTASMYADLMGSAIEEVNFREIAQHIIDENQ